MSALDPRWPAPARRVVEFLASVAGHRRGETAEALRDRYERKRRGQLEPDPPDAELRLTIRLEADDR